MRPGYSSRRERIESIRAARRAGAAQASVAIAISNAGEAPNAKWMPISRLR